MHSLGCQFCEHWECGEHWEYREHMTLNGMHIPTWRIYIYIINL